MGTDANLYNLRYMKRVYLGRWHNYSSIFNEGQLYTSYEIEEIIRMNNTREMGRIEEDLSREITASPDGLFTIVPDYNYHLVDILDSITQEPASKLKSIVQDLATVTPNIDPNNLSTADKSQLYAIAGYFNSLVNKIKPPEEKADVTMQELEEGKKYNDV